MAGSLGCRTVRIPEDHDMLAPFVLGHPKAKPAESKRKNPPPHPQMDQENFTNAAPCKDGVSSLFFSQNLPYYLSRFFPVGRLMHKIGVT